MSLSLPESDPRPNRRSLLLKMLQNLPQELLRVVFDNIYQKAHLAAISLVCRTFRVLVLHKLFEVITIRPKDEQHLWDFDAVKLFDDKNVREASRFLATYVRKVAFAAPFEATNNDGADRCGHKWEHVESDSDGDLEEWEQERTVDTKKTRYEPCTQRDGPAPGFRELDGNLRRLAEQTMKLLVALPVNQLKEFRTECYFDHDSRVALKGFCNLKHLSWRGLMSKSAFSAVRALLEHHHQKIESLELDFISWSILESRFYTDIDVGEEPQFVFPTNLDGNKQLLPRLQNLALTAACMQEASSVDREAYPSPGLNLGTIDRLCLNNCLGTMGLIAKLAEAGIKATAKTLELMLLVEEEDDDLDHGVCDFFTGPRSDIDFFAPFDTLCDLFLTVESCSSRHDCLVDSILKRRNTLRRLVYHKRNTPYQEEFHDAKLSEPGAWVYILATISLEGLGICDDPFALKKSFESLPSTAATKQSLKILHLRSAGKSSWKPKFVDPTFWNTWSTPDLDSHDYRQTFSFAWPAREQERLQNEELRDEDALADWAFSPVGFPNLRVLAFGDFSHGKRFKSRQRLLCRNGVLGKTAAGKSWRDLDMERDIIDGELVERNMDLLAACPVSPLLWGLGRADEWPGIS
ncbi:uncharacterized protein KY384_009013 [Bacidia gigantensis]|uniref:uncharacterized protein n=1 Tax=Bacidia gigantensis TaxID=2732470 RepID=UPI001D039175|nr:uncharacterized protein KY384_009013 [Bacidia gigantensis]KAG8525369.1 hypothetical protein KY384_009013 [Bacidia gigantensis]